MSRPKLHRNSGRGKPSRAQRRALMQKYDISSGRQWKKLKKSLQRAFREGQRAQ